MEFLLLWFVFGIIASVIGSNKGESGCLWFIYGIVLGPIGVIFALFAGSKCPACKKTIHTKATKCPYCQTELKP